MVVSGVRRRARSYRVYFGGRRRASGASRRPQTASERRLTPLAAAVRDPGPVGLGGELDRLAIALGLDVAEGVRDVVEEHVELALLDPLVQPGGAEDESPQPVHERALGGADELGPAVVDVLAEGGGGILDLAVDGQVDQILQLGGLEAGVEEAELAGRLLHALGEVTLVEGEPELSVLEDVVLAGVVVA